MPSSKNTSLGTLLITVLIVLIVLQFMPFILGPFHIFPHFLKHAFTDFGPDNAFPVLGFYGTVLIPLALMILWIIVVVWVYKDAEAHGMNGLLWALLVLVGNIIGLIVYLIVRAGVLPPAPSANVSEQNPCPHCGKQVSGNFAFCPYCGASLREKCPGCGKDIQPDWQVCPHCGTKLNKEE